MQVHEARTGDLGALEMTGPARVEHSHDPRRYVARRAPDRLLEPHRDRRREVRGMVRVGRRRERDAGGGNGQAGFVERRVHRGLQFVTDHWSSSRAWEEAATAAARRDAVAW